jgi:hydrogenase maturation protease
MKTLILGLGNPLLGDDGVGWKVAEAVKQQIADGRLAWPLGVAERLSAIEVDCHSGGGLSLMERLVGYAEAIVIDAIHLGLQPTGAVACFSLEALPNPAAGHLGSAHETNLPTALQLGRALGAHLPRRVTIVAIESPNVYDFSECLTPPVAEAVPVAARRVLEILEGKTYGLP